MKRRRRRHVIIVSEKQRLAKQQADVIVSEKLRLAKQADVILRRANCDAMTGEKKDRQYRRDMRVKRKYLNRRRRVKAIQFGKLGPASVGKRITRE